jgi:mRNA interferase MazF
VGSFAVGDVVLLAFPYADFSAYKVRPALIVGRAEFSSFITCQITSRAATSKKALPLTDHEFKTGGLRIDSYVRPDKLFTIEASIIQAKVGSLRVDKMKQIKDSIIVLFS